MRINTGQRYIKSDTIDAQQPDGKQKLRSQLGYFEDVQDGPKQNNLAAKMPSFGTEHLQTSYPGKRGQAVYSTHLPLNKPMT